MSNLKLVFHRMVQADMMDAHSWYNSSRAGLGDDFVLAVEACLDGIKRNPEHFPFVEVKIRRAIVSRFPYLVAFTILKDRILVIAIMHTKRDQALLKTRIGK